jgi:hypothetical protein
MLVTSQERVTQVIEQSHSLCWWIFDGASDRRNGRDEAERYEDKIVLKLEKGLSSI